jgi:hypothetical protein
MAAMGIRRMGWAIALLGLGLALPASGADGASGAGRDAFVPRFEVTPWGGYRFGGSFDFDAGEPDTSTFDVRDGGSVGVDLGIYRDALSFYELLYGSQSSRLDTNGATTDVLKLRTDYYQLGGTLLFPQPNNLVAWLSMTAGVTRFSPGGSLQGETLSPESDFSMSLGGGLRIPLNPHFSIVGGVRGYLTFIDPSSRIFCVSNGGATCVFQLSGSTYFQIEGLLGLALTF